jgi:hypothetical protein
MQARPKLDGKQACTGGDHDETAAGGYMTSDWQHLETMTVVCITAVVGAQPGDRLGCRHISFTLESMLSRQTPSSQCSHASRQSDGSQSQETRHRSQMIIHARLTG